MHVALLFVQLLLLCMSLVAGNVEKAIFLAPDLDATDPSALRDLELRVLSPTNPSVRTELDAKFPSEDAPRGAETWVYLDSLRPGQRYEVRVCWLATQPTEFTLSTYTLPEILDSPSLRSSLMAAPYAKPGQRLNDPTRHQSLQATSETRTAVFLLIESAADYFTTNKTLMATVPPVHADVILDPYIFNVLPESLVPTAGYLVVVAVAAWFLSKYVWSVIRDIAQGGETSKTKGSQVAGKKKRV